MFRCQVCDEVSRPGQAMTRHTVYREVVTQVWTSGLPKEVRRKEIEREIPVCRVCAELLARGLTADEIRYKEDPSLRPVDLNVPPPRVQTPIKFGKLVSRTKS